MVRKSSRSPSSNGSNKWGLGKTLRGYHPDDVEAYLTALETGAAPPEGGLRVVVRGYDIAQVDEIINSMTGGSRP
ncbi:hypothetical protein [Actinomadura sp. 9N407]|uniref:hypothetical protein n=1 Tax=Actinomadura sp. 9N407 TaxID=3375154 RepID=UPI0037A4F5A7